MRNNLLLSLTITLILAGCGSPNDRRTVITRGPVGTIETSCTAGYALLPPVSGYTTTSLCVGKYEAQIVSGKAVSTTGAGSTIRLRSQAAAACTANGSRHSLISNNQWQALSRNIESVAKNWSGGTVGSGALSLGHSDTDPNNAVVPGPDANGCFNNGDSDCTATEWHFQKRTHVLSNGQIIWDLAGNLPEWVSDVPDADFSSLQSGMAVMDLSRTTLKKVFGPSLTNMSALELGLNGGLGYLRSSIDPGDIPVGVIRGGGFESLADSGIFAAEINVPAETDAYDSMPLNVGFRCVYIP